MKALLVTLPPLEPFYPPPILGILAACCTKCNVEYEICDCNLYMYDTFELNDVIELSNDIKDSKLSSHKNVDQICLYLNNKIRSYQPDYLCISVFSYQQQFIAEYFLQKIHAANNKCKIIIGGSGVNTPYKLHDNFGEYCLQKNYIDYYIYGDGEKAFMQLLTGNSNYPGINNKNFLQITDLDSLPVPEYTKINPKDYHYAFDPELIVSGSRGCVRDCSFCNVKDIWNKFVYKSGDKIADEIFYLYTTTGISHFTFSDSLINGSIKTFRQFNKKLIEYKSQHPNFDPKYKGQFICRPVGQMKESDYDEMSRAGADTLVVGVESFSNNVRNHMRKHFDNAAIDNHLLLCAKYGIRNVFLLLTGYVTETYDDHQENLNYLKKYQVYALSDIISNIGFNVGGLNLIPNSGVPLNKLEQDLNIVYHETDLTNQEWTSLNNPTLTQKERYRRGAEILLTAVELGYKVMYMDSNLDKLERFYSAINNKQHKKIPITY